ncbi:MAG: VCBS repeat-containing protein [Phycisphaeraceae bacterium]
MRPLTHIKILLRLLACGMFVVYARPLRADTPLFGDPMIVLKSPNGTGSSVAGDFNNDGRSEFVASVRSNSLRLYQWNPDTSSMVETIIAPNDKSLGHRNRFGGDLTVADMDGDGFLDLVVPNSNNNLGPGCVFWYRNPGTLTLNWERHTVTTWSGTGTQNADNYVRHMSEIKVADLSGNGHPDIVTRDVQYGLFVMLNHGDGRWTRRHIPTHPREGLALADINGDGRPDIVINGLWFETPAGNLATAQFVQHIYAADQYPADNNRGSQDNYAKKVKVADMNGDGRIDIIVSNAEQLSGATTGGPKGIRIYLAPEHATGAWQEVLIQAPQVRLASLFSLHTLEVGDLDHDGDLDILTAVSSVGVDKAPGQVFALLNSGNGTAFTFRSILKEFAYNNVIADADGDGDLDLFGGTDFGGGHVRYFQNLSPVPQPPARP